MVWNFLPQPLMCLVVRSSALHVQWWCIHLLFQKVSTIFKEEKWLSTVKLLTLLPCPLLQTLDKKRVHVTR